MLTLHGTLRTAEQLGGGQNKKTGQVIPVRSIVQVEANDERGLVQLHTITVPDHLPYQKLIGQSVNLPVRAWASGAAVNYSWRGEVV
jgi:hypothetical protein